MKQLKVLVIDDSPFIFKAVKRALEPEGIQVVDNALNGKIGLELIEQYKPDIITLDVTMPVMDGIETACYIYDKNPDANIIMMSAMGDDALIEEAKSIGVRHFIPKPFKPDILLNAIQDTLKGDF
ncbi:response regulator [Natronospora cellulosivora (SeqCode)]